MSKLFKSILIASFLTLPLAAYAQEPDEPKSGEGESSEGQEEGGSVADEGQQAEPQETETPKQSPFMQKMKKMKKMKKMHKAMHDGSDEVVRAEAGNMGLYFSFMGLASLGFNAVDVTRDQNGIMKGIVVAGMKLVPNDNIIIPVGVGFRFFHQDVDSDFDTDTNSFGVAISAAVEYHFKVWKRISPYFGARVQLDYLEPAGDDNWEFGLALGPAIGVEYYIADRVSLSAEYNLMIDNRFSDGAAKGGDVNTDFNFATGVTNAGGVYLTFYF